MPKLLCLAFVHLFYCLLNQELPIRAQEAPVKRVQGAKNSVDERFFYIGMRTYFFDIETKIEDDRKCGATFFSERQVISAGNCVMQYGKTFLRAQLSIGDHRISRTELSQRKFDDYDYYVYPKEVFYFDRSSYLRLYDNGYTTDPDLALLELKPGIYEQFRKAVILPVCSAHLFSKIRNFGGKVSVVGMGRTQRDIEESMATVLQEATLEVTRTQNPCKNYYKRGAHDHHVLCAVGIKCFRFMGQPRKIAYKNEKTTCFGDNGGPIFHKYENGTPHCLVGIVGYELLPISAKDRNLIEKLSPFHDGSGSGELFTSLEPLQDFISMNFFINIQQWNQQQVSWIVERRRRPLPPLVTPH